MEVLNLTPAERRWLRPRHAAHAVFSALRHVTTAEVKSWLADAPSLDEARLRDLEVELHDVASRAGLAALLEEQTSLVTTAVIGAYDDSIGAIARVEGNDYPLFNGPEYPLWSYFARRAALHTASLIVDPYLTDEERDESRIPGLPADPIADRPSAAA